MKFYYNHETETIESETSLEIFYNETYTTNDFNNCYGDFDRWLESCKTENNGELTEITVLTGLHPNMTYDELLNDVFMDLESDSLVTRDILIYNWRHSNSLNSFNDWIEQETSWCKMTLIQVDCTEIADDINTYFKDFER